MHVVRLCAAATFVCGALLATAGLVDLDLGGDPTLLFPGGALLVTGVVALVIAGRPARARRPEPGSGRVG